MTNCKNCSKRLRGWQYRLIGYCYQCHKLSFQVRKRKLPPCRRWHKGGWQALLSAGDLERWRKWEYSIIERIDRENETADSTDLAD